MILSENSLVIIDDSSGNYMDELPPEIMAKIFANVDALSQVQLRRVCWRWNFILSSYSVKRKILLILPDQDNSVQNRLRSKHVVERVVSSKTRYLIISTSRSPNQDRHRHLRPTLFHPCAFSISPNICQNVRRLTLTNGFVELRVFSNLPQTIEVITLGRMTIGRITALMPMMYEFETAVPFATMITNLETPSTLIDQVLLVVEKFTRRLTKVEIKKMADVIGKVGNPVILSRIQTIIKRRENVEVIPDNLDYNGLRTLTLWDLSVYLNRTKH